MASLVKVQEALAKKTEALKRYRDKNKDASEGAIEVVAVIAGGAAGGYMNKEMGEFETLGVDWSLFVGAGSLLAGMFGMGGQYSRALTKFGAGVLAHEAGKKTEAA